MDQSCPHCDQPESSLLRVILIGAIVRAEEAMLSTLADLMQRLGLLDRVEEQAGLKSHRGGSAPADPAS